MSDIVIPLIEHLMEMSMFAPWLTWFCRELIIYFLNRSTKLSTVTGLALTVGVIMQSAYDRTSHLFESMTSYEAYIVLVLILITLVKIRGLPGYAIRDVPMVLTVAVIVLLAIFGVNIMIVFPISLGVILGLIGITGNIGRERVD